MLDDQFMKGEEIDMMKETCTEDDCHYRTAGGGGVVRCLLVFRATEEKGVCCVRHHHTRRLFDSFFVMSPLIEGCKWMRYALSGRWWVSFVDGTKLSTTCKIFISPMCVLLVLTFTRSLLFRYLNNYTLW